MLNLAIGMQYTLWLYVAFSLAICLATLWATRSMFTGMWVKNRSKGRFTQLFIPTFVVLNILIKAFIWPIPGWGLTPRILLPRQWS